MKGIDISKWQGKIDWSSVNNIDFVYIRASIGVGTHDEFLNTNANAVYSSGLKIGYYHFATLKPSSEQDPANRAAEEANYFISLIKNLPAPTMPIALDIEENPVGLTKDEVLSYIHAFLGVLKNEGYDVCLYSYGPFFDANLPNNHDLGSEKLWLADYRSAPHIPHGWNNYWLWQNSNSGTEHGITGKVDTDQTA